MSAVAFGYPVLPGRALDTPGVEEVLRRRERGLRRGVGAAAVQAVLIVGAVGVFGPSSPAAVGAVVVLVPLLAVTVGLSLLWRRARRRERRVMETYGWQVWPCAGQDVRVVAAEGRREGGRRWSAEGRVVLLGPDGRSHCSFPPPGEGWDGPRVPARREGPGEEVWFAGDTRFGGMLAEPGGMPFRYVTRARPGRGAGSAEQDGAARRAGLVPRGWRPGGRA
ncbi:hypothetical protein ABZ891_29530 [Streptomyces sp. NPDC047023]|uniref:hypothetical protein n=1 Tax=Streptomyces sp. NPDC047023 TaxID=3155139 RepID=UPI003404EAF1